jgi:hypothetical protein
MDFRKKRANRRHSLFFSLVSREALPSNRTAKMGVGLKPLFRVVPAPGVFFLPNDYTP